MDISAKLLRVFWNEHFWLPANKTWKDVKPGKNGINHADHRHLIYPIPIALLLILIRFFIDRYFFKPFGKSLGIKSNHRKLTSNLELEKNYRKNVKLSPQIIQNICKQLDISEREIERWWRLRKSQDKPTKIKKFSENCWRFFAYLFNFSFGLVVLWDKSWLWNFPDCGFQYPHHDVTDGIWWYYMISLGFYCSQFITHFTDIKRKDFWQMFIHHVVTLMLLSISWIMNMFRIGSLILLVHDCSDVLLEFIKALKRAKLHKACDNLFILFVIVWIVTRLLIFPRLIFVNTFMSPERNCPGLFLINFLLVLLLLLHIFWTFLIFKVVVAFWKKSHIERDVRSSEDESEESTSKDNDRKRK